MKEKTLLKIALLTSLFGVISLWILSENLTVDETTIDKITFENIGDRMKVIGYVTNVLDLGYTKIIEVSQMNNIDVVVFSEDNKSLNLFPNDRIEVLGNLEEYRGEKEIIAHRIRKIS